MELRGLEPEWVEIDGAEFLVEPMDSPTQVRVMGAFAREDEYRGFEIACKACVKSWRGVHKPGGSEEIRFSPDLLGRLPVATWAKLGQKIIEINEFGDSEQKKS